MGLGKKAVLASESSNPPVYRFKTHFASADATVLQRPGFESSGLATRSDAKREYGASGSQNPADSLWKASKRLEQKKALA